MLYEHYLIITTISKDGISFINIAVTAEKSIYWVYSDRNKNTIFSKFCSEKISDHDGCTL